MDEIKPASDKKRTRITTQKILKKYKNMKRPKRTYLVNEVNEEDIDTIDYNEPLQDDVFAGESIVNAANKVIDFEQLKKDQEKRLQEYNDQLLNDAANEIKTASDKKRTRITAQKILKKYKNMKRPKRTYLVNEEDIDTIDYNEPLQDDAFAGESIVNASNKVMDFEQFKKEQEKRLQEYNDQLLNDVRENKNLKMVAKKISDKYKKIRRKRKAATSVPTLHRQSEIFVPDKRSSKKVIKLHSLPPEKYQKSIKNSMAEFKKTKNAFDKLKLGPSSVAFAEEILDKKLLAKLKKSRYAADRNFFNIVNLLENNNVILIVIM